jgi:hypothetical protein
MRGYDKDKVRTDSAQVRITAFFGGAAQPQR